MLIHAVFAVVGLFRRCWSSSFSAGLFSTIKLSTWRKRSLMPLFRASLPFNQIIYLAQASACAFKKVSIKYKQIFKFNDCSECQQHKRTLALKSFRFSFVTGFILTTKKSTWRKRPLVPLFRASLSSIKIIYLAQASACVFKKNHSLNGSQFFIFL